jgi:hypothetical protein
MPIRDFGLFFDGANTQPQEVVANGSVINGLTFFDIPIGMDLYLKLGNNQRTGPIRNPISLDFGPGSDFADVSEGVWLQIDVPAPGARPFGFASYSSANAGTPAARRG